MAAYVCFVHNRSKCCDENQGTYVNTDLLPLLKPWPFIIEFPPYIHYLIQTLANLKKSEKEKEFFQEGYLEELEKREKAEGKILICTLCKSFSCA